MIVSHWVYLNIQSAAAASILQIEPESKASRIPLALISIVCTMWALAGFRSESFFHSGKSEAIAELDTLSRMISVGVSRKPWSLLVEKAIIVEVKVEEEEQVLIYPNLFSTFSVQPICWIFKWQWAEREREMWMGQVANKALEVLVPTWGEINVSLTAAVALVILVSFLQHASAAGKETARPAEKQKGMHLPAVSELETVLNRSTVQEGNKAISVTPYHSCLFLILQSLVLLQLLWKKIVTSG